MNQHIATIPKNSIDEVRISFSEFKGRTYIDIRTFTELESSKERVPTKKGIALNPALLPELRAALSQAEDEARAAGLLRD